jgi:hypothetical protein
VDEARLWRLFQWQSATTPGFLELWWFDLAWVSHVCVCARLCVRRPGVASAYAFCGWNAMAGKQVKERERSLGKVTVLTVVR